MHECSHQDDIKEIKQDVKELKESFQDFRLTASMDIVEIKTKAKFAGGVAGLIFGLISSTIVALLKVKIF